MQTRGLKFTRLRLHPDAQCEQVGLRGRLASHAMDFLCSVTQWLTPSVSLDSSRGRSLL